MTQAGSWRHGGPAVGAPTPCTEPKAQRWGDASPSRRALRLPPHPKPQEGHSTWITGPWFPGQGQEGLLGPAVTQQRPLENRDGLRPAPGSSPTPPATSCHPGTPPSRTRHMVGGLDGVRSLRRAPPHPAPGSRRGFQRGEEGGRGGGGSRIRELSGFSPLLPQSH